MLAEDWFFTILPILALGAMITAAIFSSMHPTINVVELKDGNVLECKYVECYKQGSCHISGCGDGIEYTTDEYKILYTYTK